MFKCIQIRRYPMNFVFISPNFPDHYSHFCRHLAENGVTVLGIGDAPYESLNDELKESLTEYYKVDTMLDYDEMYRALGWFAHKHGRIDWIESNNEFWLEQDARLRSDFNVTTGLKANEIYRWRSKSAMKKYYAEAGIPAARYHLCDTVENALTFIEQVGYPVIVKPDKGVGASATYKIKNEKQLREFFAEKLDIPYIMEEFITGEVTTYDGLIDQNGKVLFAASHVTPLSIMDMVNEQLPCCYYVNSEVPAEVKDAGERVLKAFDVKARCFHLEFFRLLKDHEGLGKYGDIVALEVNMRPAGGLTPDMLNFSQSSDIYQLYADMVAFGEPRHTYTNKHYYTMYVGRRDQAEYTYTLGDLRNEYEENIRIDTRIPDSISDAMGNDGIVACFETLQEMNKFMKKALAPMKIHSIRTYKQA